MRIPLFRIWYSTTYTVLFFILIVLLAISPGEQIYQAIRAKELQKLFVIGGVYVLTFLVAFLVYSTRLYTNRTVLQAIPKPYVPIEDGEVGKLVRRIIVKALRRSAIVAWDARPRDITSEAHGIDEEEGMPASAERKHSTHLKRRSHLRETTIIPVSAKSPPWGHVSHPGWASPSSPDLPNLQYWDVVAELPNLIEAKAVSLAPPDPALDGLPQAQDNTPMLPDAEIVALLQRPRATGLRDYLAQLATYGLINPPSLGPKFLTQYEYARFSTHSLTEPQFRSLMAVFAEILNGMTDLDPVVIDEARAGFDNDNRSLTPSSSSNSTRSGLAYRTPQADRHSEYSYSSGTESPQTVRTAPSMQRNFSMGTHVIPRAPSERSLGSQQGSVVIRQAERSPRTPSERSLESESGSVVFRPAQRSPDTILPNSSEESSLRSQRSVVRLRSSPGVGELPYEYHYDEG
jgi:hypothetical protein